MLKRVLMRVDFPRPDSPKDKLGNKFNFERKRANKPTTMAVNWKPFLTLFLWTWLGRFAKPT